MFKLSNSVRYELRSNNNKLMLSKPKNKFNETYFNSVMLLLKFGMKEIKTLELSFTVSYWVGFECEDFTVTIRGGWMGVSYTVCNYTA